jgi:hypothetical protein
MKAAFIAEGLGDWFSALEIDRNRSRRVGVELHFIEIDRNRSRRVGVDLHFDMGHWRASGREEVGGERAEGVVGGVV